MTYPRRRPASTTAGFLGGALAVWLGADGDTAQAVAALVVAVAPGVVAEIAEHGIAGAARRLWRGRRA